LLVLFFSEYFISKLIFVLPMNITILSSLQKQKKSILSDFYDSLKKSDFYD